MNIQPPDNGILKLPVQEDDAQSAKSVQCTQGRVYQHLEENTDLASLALDLDDFRKDPKLTGDEKTDHKYTHLIFNDVPKLDLSQTDPKKSAGNKILASPHNAISARLAAKRDSPQHGSPPYQLSESSPSRSHPKGSPKNESQRSDKRNSPKSQPDSPLSESPKSDGRGSPKDKPEAAGSEKRRTRRLSIVALEFIPSNIVEHLIEEDILKLPESEASWRNKKEFPDDAIMNLPGSSFCKVPLQRIADMPAEKIKLMTVEQIKLTSYPQLQMLLSKHVKNLSLPCLAAIDLVQVKKMNKLFVGMTLCQDEIYNKLTEKQQGSLKLERRIYEAATSIHTMASKSIEELPFEVVDALPIRLIENLDKGRIITIFKTHWRQLNEEKTGKLLEFVEKNDIRHFDPDLIVAKFANKENASVSQKRLFANAGKRVQLRNIIRQFKPVFTGIPDPAERIKYLVHFMTIDNVAGVYISTMKPHLYCEAMTMKEPDYGLFLTDFDAIGQLCCTHRPNKSYAPMPFTEIPDDRISSILFDMRSYKPSNGPSEHNHLIRLYSNNCSIILGSLFPLITSEKDAATRRAGDPIGDDMVFQKLTSENMTCLLFSGADGRGWGSEAAETAAYANQGFMQNALHEICNGFKNLHDLVDIMARSVKNAHLSIKNKTDGFTVHMGIIALRTSSSNNNEGHWDILINNVGYSKFLFYNNKTKSCRELGPIRPQEEIFDKYPVGCLGKFFKSGDPDLKNYTLISLEANDEDILIPMSKGIYYNLDPKNLCISPQEAYLKLKARDQFILPGQFENASFSEKKEDWNESLECELLRKTFIEMLAFDLISSALNSQKADIPKAIVEHALQATRQTRTYMRQHPDENMPAPGTVKIMSQDGKNVEVMMTGFVDHMSVAAIKLKK